MRARSTLLGCILLGLFTASCAAPFSGPPEKLQMPKKKKKKEPTAEEQMALDEEAANQCKVDFDGPPVSLSRRKSRDANQIVQDAENEMAGIENKPVPERREMVVTAIGKLKSALAADPYNPQATFTLAVAYGTVGKKKCAIDLLERLADLEGIPENVKEVSTLKGRVKKHPAFKSFEADAAAALGD